MSPADFLRQLWSGHRVLVSAVAVLLLANLAVGLTLQQYLVPTVSEREQLVIRRQSELRSGGGSSPAQLLAQGEKDLAAFRDKIPPYREFTGLIVELQKLAEDAGLDLNQISYKSEREKETPLLRYTLTFTVVGSYHDIKQFIHALEQSSRLILLRQIGLQGGGQASDTDVRLQLSLETFFRAGVS
jgi:Tfp pilus assembly protein PilO